MDKKSFIQVVNIGHFDISTWNLKYIYIIFKKGTQT